MKKLFNILNEDPESVPWRFNIGGFGELTFLIGVWTALGLTFLSPE